MDQKHCEEEMVTAANPATRPQPHGRATHLEHFKKALESPRLFHGERVKHLLKDCATMKGYICSTLGQ
jgi:hypothetical protein